MDISHKGVVSNYGEGGATKRERGRGANEVLPLRKGGGGADKKVSTMLKGGGRTCFGEVFPRRPEVLAILKGGGVQKVSTLRKWALEKKLPCLEEGGGGEGRVQKVSDPRFSHFVAPLPVINDQSLSEQW